MNADGNDAADSMDIMVEPLSPHWHTRTRAVQCLGRQPGSKDICILLCSHQHRGSGESRFFVCVLPSSSSFEVEGGEYLPGAFYFSYAFSIPLDYTRPSILSALSRAFSLSRCSTFLPVHCMLSDKLLSSFTANLLSDLA